ncbi:PREDICTED: protein-lysine methyltransferase METTL21C-like [Nanorana parkeri]|uniref:protein-lysine methyltransferase METTL21C-like n=1 Tax=Nanorana parkeri TaxID=125878 RepID=UPI000854DCC7|nr:PREDICTED: protein-lysine methyltransferase METTL21C-like [Nanorana parkeri]
MDAERLECLSCVQPVLSAAEEEDSWEGSDETVGDQEGRSEPQHLQTPQLGDDKEEFTCDLKPCIQPFKAWAPTVYSCFGKEHLWYAGYEIIIQESFEGYAGVIWPGAKALCYFLEENQDEFDLRNKKVLEIGSGTGLVSIVACILGAHVLATDVPDVLGNLRFNLVRNTRGRCLHMPEVKELVWGQDLESKYPKIPCTYDYILAADVVYHHTCLDQLLETMKHLCQPGTQLIWANKFRFNTDLDFLANFNKSFQTEVLAELPDLEVKIFKARHEVD